MRAWKSIPQHQRTFYLAMFFGTALTLFFMFVLSSNPTFQRTELIAYDWHFQQRGQHAYIPSNIRIVAVDQTSLDDLNQGTTPLPRSDIGRAITYLCKAGA